MLLGLLVPPLAAETLYNGIELPKPWPPRGRELTRQPLATPPYLQSPPPTIPIDTGRQLLVDDFLVEQTDLRRTYHRPKYHPASPVIAPDRPWEDGRSGVFSDGVWFDPADGLFKAWYWSKAGTCYATSRDGIRWQKPNLEVVPGTNIVVPDQAQFPRNSSTTWLDLFEPDPARRFKMFTVVIDRSPTGGGDKGNRKFIQFRISPDGVHWREAGQSFNCSDRSTVFFNPFRKQWIFSLRESGKQRCAPLKADQTAMKVNWSNASDLRAVAGKPVKLRFHLRQGSLYSFWTSPAAHGASGGYVGAGGPGFSGPTDTVGPAGNRL